MIDVRIEKDSVNKAGKRITTFILKYPRFIHSELMTHRMFSRNASSSRAIPLEKSIKYIEDTTAYPISFKKNKKGMQGGEDLSDENEKKARKIWKRACKNAIKAARDINNLEEEGVHKQYVNRLLEPFSHITVIVTATDFDNFFKLRCHKDAQPEIYALAREMQHQYLTNEPKKLNTGEWHLPFIIEEDEKKLDLKQQLMKSVACCARVSYNNHDGTKPTQEQNEKLYHHLVTSTPIHGSPAEHQARSSVATWMMNGNFRGGWVQYRGILEEEMKKAKGESKGTSFGERLDIEKELE